MKAEWKVLATQAKIDREAPKPLPEAKIRKEGWGDNGWHPQHRDEHWVKNAFTLFAITSLIMLAVGVGLYFVFLHH